MGGAFLGLNWPGSMIISGLDIERSGPTYIMSTPFRINSNADFPAYANGSGNGTADNPWIIENYEIDGTGYGYCMFIGNTTEHFIVRDCYMHDASGGGIMGYENLGIYVYSSENFSIINCTFERNEDAMFLSYSVNFAVLFNTLADNINGISVLDCEHNIVSSNYLANSGGIGIFHSRDSHIQNNTISNAAYSCLIIQASTDSMILNNDISGSFIGMNVYESTNNTFRSNECRNNTYGIQVWFSESNIFENNQLYNNAENGLELRYSGNNSIMNNTVTGNKYGIHLSDSSHNTLINNTATSNIAGVWVEYSSHNTLASNSFQCNAFGFYYAFSDVNIFMNNDVSLNDDGGYLYESRNISVHQNIVSHNVRIGLVSIYSSACNIINNTINNNEEGICVDYSNSLVIKQNIVDGNTYFGMSLHQTTNCVINYNHISNNSFGLAVYTSNSNLIFHNTFASNVYQGINYNSPNQWHNGYPSGGNYWGDYTGVDNRNGPAQNNPGSDGIGDTPYTAIHGDSGARDNYPLMRDSSFGTLPTSFIGDTGAYWHRTGTVNISVAAIKTVDGQVANVALLYEYSADNVTWSPLTDFEVMHEEPWNYTFDFPDGEGHYKLYSIACDSIGNVEPLPDNADEICGFDKTPPEIEDYSLAEATTGDAYTFHCLVTDNIAFSEVRVIFRIGRELEMNLSFVQSSGGYGNRTITMPSDELTVLEYSIAVTDKAGNWNVSAVRAIPIIDNDPPVADASENQTVNWGDPVNFNGKASTDNIGITNYTWMFQYDGGTITLYGPMPTFVFLTPGNFTVVLTVSDAAGNSANDTVAVRSLPAPDSDEDGVPNHEDAFPTDPAASVDSDGDGYPDAWNPGMTVDDSTTDLILDAFPDDPDRWAEEDDNDDTTPEQDGLLTRFWWLWILIVMLAIIGMLVAFRGNAASVEQAAGIPAEASEAVEPTARQEPALETEICPNCGLDIEKGAPCPFCAPEPAPESIPESEPQKVEPPKSGLTNEDKLERIEKAYKEGKMSEEQYLRNKEKFQ
jgi:parallel beta-helix repeat protein